MSNGSPAAFHAFINLFAVTLLPKSFPACLTAPTASLAAPATAPLAFPAAPLTAPPTLLAKLPKPRFAFAPSVLGLSKPSSPCAGSASARYNSNFSCIEIDSVPLTATLSSAGWFSPPFKSNSSCFFSSGSIGFALCDLSALSSTVARAPCTTAPSPPPAFLIASINASPSAAFASNSFKLPDVKLSLGMSLIASKAAVRFFASVLFCIAPIKS